MEHISCRRDFDNPIAFGPLLMKNLEWTSKTGFPVGPKQIYVHGYNNSVASALDSYQLVDASVQAPGLEGLGWYWPGGTIAADYPLAVIRARDAGWAFRNLLWGLHSTIDVQTHSLGARVALTALKYGGFQIRHLLLSAPAVDDGCLAANGEFVRALDFCETVNVFFSQRDRVLRVDYPLGTFFREQALGYRGPVGELSPKIRAFDCTAIVDAHGAYRRAPKYYAAWRSILDGSAPMGLTVIA